MAKRNVCTAGRPKLGLSLDPAAGVPRHDVAGFPIFSRMWSNFAVSQLAFNLSVGSLTTGNFSPFVGHAEYTRRHLCLIYTLDHRSVVHSPDFRVFMESYFPGVVERVIQPLDIQ